ncbi:maleate cis-trans isomerase family protein [Pseudomonas benzenivorans]|uniref:Aspartate/glutamate racemase family protein n=1 Tax=Pseudomonas benzenivorans TaxID=556533 RepID=A0ABY5H7D2_9PSED|nr:aspartate/glutamate racemase family protein [Pseudomonas benzenivorans]UTW08221.1 aspartate/glutamate racemase family protein [Pseudomonas benzenivorans]
MLLPYTNTNLEPDMALMAPQELSIHVTRIGGYPVEEVPGLSEMKAMASTSLEEALTLLSATGPDLVIYGCTSATLSLGPEGDSAFANQLSLDAGCPAITTSGAILASLHRLGAKRVHFVTPYDAALTQRGSDFLTEAGFEVVAQTYPSTPLTSLQQGELTPDRIIEMIIAGDHNSADVLVLSCTDMRAVECIEALETVTGLPVVTSNQALFHELLLQLHLPTANVPGRLARSRAE